MLVANKNDPPDYSVSGESPLGSYHREGTFALIVTDERETCLALWLSGSPKKMSHNRVERV